MLTLYPLTTIHPPPITSRARVKDCARAIAKEEGVTTNHTEKEAVNATKILVFTASPMTTISTHYRLFTRTLIDISIYLPFNRLKTLFLRLIINILLIIISRPRRCRRPIEADFESVGIAAVFLTEVANLAAASPQRNVGMSAPEVEVDASSVVALRLHLPLIEPEGVEVHFAFPLRLRGLKTRLRTVPRGVNSSDARATER